MKRRQAFSLALGGLAGIPGCRESEKPDQESVVDEPAGTPVPEPSFLEGSDLTPARIEPTLEVRSTVGLRPFRRPGFVVRRDERGGKTVIHNYGHGGGGISLSWGSSNLAIELAGPLTGVLCGVVGSGVLGLSTARLRQHRTSRAHNGGRPRSFPGVDGQRPFKNSLLRRLIFPTGIFKNSSGWIGECV